jgi:hypothetical protein
MGWSSHAWRPASYEAERMEPSTEADAPRGIVSQIEHSPVLPPGTDERFAGYGVMGLPFRGGHYLALRASQPARSAGRTRRSGYATPPTTGRS